MIFVFSFGPNQKIISFCLYFLYNCVKFLNVIICIFLKIESTRRTVNQLDSYLEIVRTDTSILRWSEGFKCLVLARTKRKYLIVDFTKFYS